MIESYFTINETENWINRSLYTIQKNRHSFQGKMYLTNLIVNLKLTGYHLCKTFERLVTAVYYLATSLFSGLGVVFSLGMLKELNKFSSNQIVEFGIHASATIASIILSIGNIFAGLEGFFSFEVLENPISTESSLKHESNLINDQRELDKLIITLENYHYVHGIFKLLSGEAARESCLP